MKDLCVVVPVYNESEVIEFVIDEWSNHLKDLNMQILEALDNYHHQN